MKFHVACIISYKISRIFSTINYYSLQGRNFAQRNFRSKGENPRKSKSFLSLLLHFCPFARLNMGKVHEEVLSGGWVRGGKVFHYNFSLIVKSRENCISAVISNSDFSIKTFPMKLFFWRFFLLTNKLSSLNEFFELFSHHSLLAESIDFLFHVLLLPQVVKHMTGVKTNFKMFELAFELCLVEERFVWLSSQTAARINDRNSSLPVWKAFSAFNDKILVTPEILLEENFYSNPNWPRDGPRRD